MVTELNKSEYIGLPIFHEVTLLSHMTECPLSKDSAC